jgi:DNA polymerase III subunit gamma/tau
MGYLVLARKYRPTTFDEVIGQESVGTTLKNAVSTGRVAHAYLFTGPRGVGKTTMARILSKALNCETGPTPAPCNKCSICKSIDTGDDVDVVEIDGASNNGVDQVRELRDNARYAAARSRTKIYIIDEVHMLSIPAFNALLKILEEPPPHVKFIFATTEPHKVLDTIKSRCQRFDFRRISASHIAGHLKTLCKKEKIKVDKGVLEAVARAAHGGMRDAESLLDQLAALATDKVTVEDLEQLSGAVPQQTIFAMLAAVADRDARKAVELLDESLNKGAADDELIQQLIDGFRELLLARVAGPDSLLIDRGEEDRKAIGELAEKFTTDSLMYLVQMFAETKQKARTSTQSRIVLELSLIKAAEIQDLRPLDEILTRLRQLEVGGRSAGTVSAPAARYSSAPPSPAPPSRAPSPAAPSHQSAPPAMTGNLWADVLAIIEQEKPPLVHFLEAAKLQPSGESTFILQIPPVGLVPVTKNKQLIETVISKVLGKPSVIEVRPGANGGAKPAPSREVAGGTAAKPKGKHVKKALDLLGGRIVATTDAPTNAKEKQ